MFTVLVAESFFHILLVDRCKSINQYANLVEVQNSSRLFKWLGLRPSFITEVPLIVTSQDEAELLSRFQAGRQLL